MRPRVRPDRAMRGDQNSCRLLPCFPKQRIEPAAGHAAVKLTAERLLALLRRLDQSYEIDAGADAERLEQVDQVLGADIAGIAAAVFDLGGMTADPAERAVEI